MNILPKQRLTFFFSDIEGSTNLLAQLGDDYAEVLEHYQNIVRSALGAYRGREMDTAGDGFFAVFKDPRMAVTAAIRMQRAFASQVWARKIDFRVRMGLHTGDAIEAQTGFIGLEVHRASRICSLAHGGQVLISNSTFEAMSGLLPEGSQVVELGEFMLKGFGEPQRLYQLIVPGMQQHFPSIETDRPMPVIAVMPFDKMGGDPGDTFLGDAMAEEIIIALGKVSGLRVVARAASFALSAQSLAPDEIGKRLNATALLFGHIRQTESRLRVAAELVDASTGYNIWAERFDRKMEDIFTVLDEIARSIASALRVKLGGRQVRDIQSMHSQDLRAYQSYIKGRHLFFNFSPDSILEALGYFKEAIEVDPDYTLAYCGLANCYAYKYVYLDKQEKYIQAAQMASMRAVELDPLLAEAYVAHGWVNSLTGKLKEAEADFNRALDLDPKLFDARFLYARTAFVMGKLEKAARLFEEAHQRKPEDYQSALLAGQVYADLGEEKKSKNARLKGVKAAEHQLELNPTDTRALYLGANGLVAMGEVEKGLAWLRKAIDMQPNDPMLLYNAGCIYSLAKMPEEALKCLKEAVEKGLSQLEWFENDSNLDPLRDREDFQKLLNQLQEMQSESHSSPYDFD